MVCDDLNCPGLNKTYVDDELLTVLKFRSSNCLEQFVLGPTREGPTSCNLLDPVVGARNTTVTSNVTVCSSFNVSDHCLGMAGALYLHSTTIMKSVVSAIVEARLDYRNSLL